MKTLKKFIVTLLVSSSIFNASAMKSALNARLATAKNKMTIDLRASFIQDQLDNDFEYLNLLKDKNERIEYLQGLLDDITFILNYKDLYPTNIDGNSQFKVYSLLQKEKPTEPRPFQRATRPVQPATRRINQPSKPQLSSLAIYNSSLRNLIEIDPRSVGKKVEQLSHEIDRLLQTNFKRTESDTKQEFDQLLDDINAAKELGYLNNVDQTIINKIQNLRDSF